jgi:hypothetical protein
MPQRPKKLLDQVCACPEFILSLRRTCRRDAIRLKHNAYSTERTYVYWVKRLVLYRNKRHPLEMGAAEAEAVLTHLARHRSRQCHELPTDVRSQVTLRLPDGLV